MIEDGVDYEVIAEELNVSTKTVQRIASEGITTGPPQPKIKSKSRKKSKKTLGDISLETRESLMRTSDDLARHADSIDQILTNVIQEKPGNTQSIKNLLISLGVVIDKQKEVMKSLRELEAVSSEDLEAAFVIIRENADGTREVIGNPPELPALNVGR